MTRIWQPNGSNAEYWRSDNPLIQGWWRFGDTPAPSWMTNGASAPYLSGLMVDCGPQKHHLKPSFTTQPTGTIFPVTGIAPWATSGSGVQFRWENSVRNQNRVSLYVEPSTWHDENTSLGANGHFDFGGPLCSGFTLIGWAQLPDFNPLPATNTARKIFGRWASSNTQGWGLLWFQNAVGGWYQMQALGFAVSAVTPTASQFYDAVIRSDTSPHFPRDRSQPFFFAMQIRYANVQSNRSLGYAASQSGQISVFIGTAASGIVASNTRTFRSTASTDRICAPLRALQSADHACPSFAGGSRVLTLSANDDSFLPSGSILDEVVYVSDGFLDNDRITHYALSGMTYVATSDPESTQFVPQYPGTDNLVAYWSFDGGNGNNTAPATRDRPELYYSLSGRSASSPFAPFVTFISGIRGGSGIRVNQVDYNIQPHTIDITPEIQRNRIPGIVSQSGLQFLFPSGSMDEGMTVIGWLKHKTPTTGTAVGDAGGAIIGWLGPSGRANAFSTTNAELVSINSSFTFSALLSGGYKTVLNRAFVADGNTRYVTSTYRNTQFPINNAANLRFLNVNGAQYTFNPSGASTYVSAIDADDSDWQLLALVWDLKAHGFYVVRNAKHLVYMTQDTISGFASDGYGQNQAIFTLINANAGGNHVDFDDWAIYKKILTIPEMSGYALQGIRRPAPDPVLSTPLKSLVGYWPLNNYVAGQRFDDYSWYRHHLSNVSGSFSNVTSLNPEATTFTTSIQLNTSGGMLSIPRIEHGANLDMSSTNNYLLSGMCAGAWLYVPSGDLSTQGRGTSGLYGDHMIMGCWDQDETLRSWFLGIRDNKFLLKARSSDGVLREATSNISIPFNSPFFIACNIFPSGYGELGYDNATMMQVCYASENEENNISYVISNSTAWSAFNLGPSACGTSGFSLLNAAHLDYGFPSGTRIADAFVHMGYLTSGQLIATKRSGITNVTLGSGSVSSNDPACISHWRMDNYNLPSEDTGPEQNKLTLVNSDGLGLQLVPGYHNSGIYLRPQDCLDTLAYNSQARRLDLGSGTQSWTFLGWVRTPDDAISYDRKFIMNKAGNDGVNNSGIQITMPSDTLQVVADISGTTAISENGDLLTGGWNHVAVVYDRTNEKFSTIINGRYAGLTQSRGFVGANPNASGMALGGRGAFSGIPTDINGIAGGGFSGILDDIMIFGRALTLPEISGLAGNSYSFNERPNTPVIGYVGAFISGIESKIVSGLIGSFLHGTNQDIAYVGGYVNAVSGVIDHAGGYIYGVGQSIGVVGSFAHGIDTVSGIYAGFLHGLGIASGVIGVYTLGAGQENAEFDITFNFQIVAAEDFDSRLEVAKSAYQNFDASLGVFRITTPPECLMQVPAVGLVTSGTPYTLTVQGSGWAYDNKSLSKVRFTFADFRGAANGQLVSGSANSGLYQASRTFDTPGWYTIKMEVTDSYGYRGSHCRPFLLLPSGSTSGAYLATLPYVSISGTPVDGTTIHRAFFTHSLSGLSNTSGLLEYTDFADQQESLVNSTEVPSGTQFVNFVRTHDYTMPGTYASVWTVSGSWGIVSDSISPNTDYGG